jgi:hypothetical protein
MVVAGSIGLLAGVRDPLEGSPAISALPPETQHHQVSYTIING